MTTELALLYLPGAPRLCPHCRQPMKHERCGVPLSPLKAAIFDVIKQAGDVGVTSTEILDGEVYRERRETTTATIKTHVRQINELLEDTPWIIGNERVTNRERRWCLQRRKARRAA
jgi:hypothetical protein